MGALWTIVKRDPRGIYVMSMAQLALNPLGLRLSGISRLPQKGVLKICPS
jgi:hypothetical protein